MEAAVDRLFTNEIRHGAARAFGADPDALELLGDFESYVYGYEREGERRVLRITHPTHRRAEEIEAEIDWVRYLTAHGMRFARPVRALEGGWTVTLGEGEARFHACAFARVPGAPATSKEWTPALFRRWGAFLGRTHRLTRDYVPSPGIQRRHRCDDDPYIRNGYDWIPEAHGETRRRWTETFGALSDLPRTPDVFGLCHTDLHQGNFHVHEGEVYGFDTDDCMYHWFLEDLSSLLYYSRGHEASERDAVAFVRWAWPEAWRGYREEHELPLAWLDHLERFLQARRLTLYALVHFKFAPGSEEHRQWEKIRRERIDPGVPVLDVDLERLAANA